MQFDVNEQGVRNLSQEMLGQMRQIAVLISEIDSMNGTLRAALGEDYNAINASVQIMKGELGSALNELNIIISMMQEYMARVGQARVSLQM